MFNWKPFTTFVPASFGPAAKPQLRITKDGRAYLNRNALDRFGGTLTSYDVLVDAEAGAFLVSPIPDTATAKGLYPLSRAKDRTATVPAVAALLKERGLFAAPMFLTAIEGHKEYGLLFPLGRVDEDAIARIHAAIAGEPVPPDTFVPTPAATPAQAVPVVRTLGAVKVALAELFDSQKLAYGLNELDEWVTHFYTLADQATILEAIDAMGRSAYVDISKKGLSELILEHKALAQSTPAFPSLPEPVVIEVRSVDEAAAEQILLAHPAPRPCAIWSPAHLAAVLRAMRQAAVKNKPMESAINGVVNASAPQRKAFVDWYDELATEIITASEDGKTQNEGWKLVLAAVAAGKAAAQE